MIFQTFYEGCLGPQELACLTSFIKNGHHVIVYSYSHESLPPFLTGRDAREIMTKEKLFALESGQHKGSYAIFSDIFRWELLKQKGGIWIDTDVMCISEDWPQSDIFFGYQDTQIINNAVMKFPAGHPLVAEAAEIAHTLGGHCAWGETGPLLLTTLVNKYNLHKYTLPEDVFYPAQFWWARNIREDAVSRDKIDEFRRLGSVCIHLWNECLRTERIDTNAFPQTESLLHHLLQQYNMLAFYEDYAMKMTLRMLLGCQ